MSHRERDIPPMKKAKSSRSGQGSEASLHFHPAWMESEIKSPKTFTKSKCYVLGWGVGERQRKQLTFGRGALGTGQDERFSLYQTYRKAAGAGQVPRTTDTMTGVTVPGTAEPV